MTTLPQAGELAERLILEVPVDTADGAGGFTRSFEPRAALWAKVRPVSGKAIETAARAGEQRRFEVILRNEDTALHRGMRFHWRMRQLDVLAVRPLDSGERFLILDCAETT